MEHPVIEIGFNWPFFQGLLSIIVIDIILSGDNSIVIAMAVQSLPRAKRRLGIIIGAGAAAVMRIFFTFIASYLMATPYIKLVGGILILWIAVKLLAENAETDVKHREAHGLLHAVWIIMVADFTMSLDNVLAVAGASGGSLLLLWFGLGLSIPLVMFTSNILSRLMERFPVIVTLGALVLGKVGADMVSTDPVVLGLTGGVPYFHGIAQVVGIGGVLAAAFWFRRKQAQVVSARVVAGPIDSGARGHEDGRQQPEIGQQTYGKGGARQVSELP